MRFCGVLRRDESLAESAPHFHYRGGGRVQCAAPSKVFRCMLLNDSCGETILNRNAPFVVKMV